jgi:hypothetical protein
MGVSSLDLVTAAGRNIAQDNPKRPEPRDPCPAFCLAFPPLPSSPVPRLGAGQRRRPLGRMAGDLRRHGSGDDGDVDPDGDGLVLDNFTTRTEAEGTTTLGRLDRVTMTEMPDGSRLGGDFEPLCRDDHLSRGCRRPDNHGRDPGEPRGAGIPSPARRTRGPTPMKPTSSPSARAISATTAATRRPRSTWKSSPATWPDLLLSGSAGSRSASKAAAASEAIAGRFDVFPPPDEEGQLKASFALGEMHPPRPEPSWRWPRCSNPRTVYPMGSRWTGRPTMRGPGSNVLRDARATRSSLLRQ